jgi:hypothetical protein
LRQNGFRRLGFAGRATACSGDCDECENQSGYCAGLRTTRCDCRGSKRSFGVEG